MKSPLTTPPRASRPLWAALAAASLAAACSGSDAPAPAPAVAPPVTPPPMAVIPGTTIPALAATDAVAAFNFVSLTGAVVTDTDESIEVADAMLATTETEEPSASI